MKKIILLGFFIFLSSTLHFYAQDKDVFIKAGKLYDSEQNKLIENQVIHIKNNKIQNIGNEDIIPEKVEIIDLSNYTVLPGLIDSHTHVLFSQEAKDDFTEHSIVSLTTESDALRALRGAKRAKSYLEEGFTSIIDLGNSGLYLDVALRDAINEGTVEGPRIFASGPIMAAEGGQIYGVSHNHQDLVDLEYRIIKNKDDAINAVREHVNMNVDVIKICADGLPNNTRLTLEEMKAIVKTAHSYGLTVTAHSVSNQSAWEAIQSGVDGIEHGFNLADSTMTLMAKKNVFLVPTENSRHYMDTYFQLTGTDPSELYWMDSYMERMKQRLHTARKKGITIIAGSDNYTDIKVSPGESSKDMFRAYYEAGMLPLDILRSATYLSAKRLKKEDELGVLKAGAKADIIAVKGELQDEFLETLENVEFVMKNGKVFKNAVKLK